MSVRAKAFTLVELLVVIPIIAILAGLLLPALADTKASGQKASCLNNLRPMGKSLLMYANDPVTANTSANSPPALLKAMDSASRQRFHQRRVAPICAAKESQVVEQHGRQTEGKPSVGGPVYALLGKRAMTVTEFAPVETLCEGDVSVRKIEPGTPTARTGRCS